MPDNSKQLSPEQLVALQEQADRERFLADREQVLLCLRSEGFRVLQDQWQLQVQAYRRLLEDRAQSSEDLRFYQGCIRGVSDFKSIVEAWVEEPEKEEEVVQ